MEMYVIQWTAFEEYNGEEIGSFDAVGRLYPTEDEARRFARSTVNEVNRDTNWIWLFTIKPVRVKAVEPTR